MRPIGTQIKEDEVFLKRADYQKELLRRLIAEKEKIKLGGGLKAIEKQKEKGKLPARERINLLIDDPKEFYELSTFAAFEMYKEYGGAPCSGTVYGIGKISGRQ
ncbi:MAG: acyl-CoA carboxylase subunit beta, partial [Ignavibacteriaceae bacterium]|nr:acyl-CoA carboxylase subunit beta [Ignavibacteriaceae bacterium]